VKPIPTFIAKPPIREVQAKAGASPAPLLTIDQAAERCNCSRRHVQNEIARGRLRIVKLGKLTRIDPRDLDEYLNDRKSGGAAPIDAGGRPRPGVSRPLHDQPRSVTDLDRTAQSHPGKAQERNLA
jgi:excisionase family DNA binding protein